MNPARPGISVIMPAYNEAALLEEAALAIMGALQSLDVDWEIIIVDDHSSDATSGLAEKLAAENDGIETFRHDSNQGIGAAFRTGVSRAGKDFVMLIPVDNPLSGEEFESYLARMPGSDIVVGVRIERTGYTWFMLMISFVYNRLFVPLLFNIGISDVNWIQAYRRNLFATGVLEIRHSGIFFLVELLARAKQNKLVITEIPVRMRHRIHGKPTFTKPTVIWRTFCDMVSFFLHTYRGKDRR